MLFRFNDAIFSQVLSSNLTASQLAYIQKQGFKTPNSLLLLAPKRYDSRKYDVPLSQLQSGSDFAIIGRLRQITKRNIRKNLTVYNAQLAMKHEFVPLVWFNQHYVIDKNHNDCFVVAYGKWESSKLGSSFQVGSFDVFYRFDDIGEGKLMPFYPEIKGVSNKTMTKIITSLVNVHAHHIEDILPDNIRQFESLLTSAQALQQFHFPMTPDDVSKARQRLSFDELFCYLFPRRYRHCMTKKELNPIMMPPSNPLIANYLDQLPYQLTGAQHRVWQNIQLDVQSLKTVFRLIQGDVGSGKTDIAILSMLIAVGAGYKSVMIVPTEILAEQHYLKCRLRLCKMGVDVWLLKGKQKKADRQRVLDALSDEKPLIVIGTHALIQTHVEIAKCGFIVVDEQHRFGVFQRQALLSKSTVGQPHCIFMTATPIPRTLMLTHYGDLDHDVIDEMPPGRQSIKTYYAKMNRMNQIHEFIRLEIQQGHQAYVVYPLIEESEHLDLQCAMDGFDHLQAVFPEYKLAALHGKMSSEDKDAIMSQFKNNHVQILVATTVIEVGIDVPNASVMVIMNAERFGLSQLHQLRGRVGRGAMQAHCFLVADAKSADSRQRIKAMLDTNNGFKLAEEDLKIRGPGNLLGSQQSGDLIFSFANILDEPRIRQITKICDTVIQNKANYQGLVDHFDASYHLISAQLN